MAGVDGKSAYFFGRAYFCQKSEHTFGRCLLESVAGVAGKRAWERGPPTEKNPQILLMKTMVTHKFDLLEGSKWYKKKFSDWKVSLSPPNSLSIYTQTDLGNFLATY